MKLQCQRKHSTPASPNLTFEFDESVDQYLIGVSNFQYTYGKWDHHVKEIKLSVNSTNSGNRIDAAVVMDLTNGGNNSLGSESFANISCLAATGDNSDKALQLNNDLSFSSDGSSSPTTLNNNTYINEAVMEGFDLAYSDGHKLRKIYANVATDVQQGQSATLTGTAGMVDDSGHNATTKQLEGSYLGTYIDGNASGLVVIEQTYNAQADCNQTTVELGGLLGDKKLTSATVFLRSFDVEFKSDHSLKTIYLGARDISFADQSVTFTPQVSLQDGNGHNTEIGSIKVVVVGTCDPD